MPFARLSSPPMCRQTRAAQGMESNMRSTLLLWTTSPVQRITGTLGQTPIVLAALGLQPAPG
jgi:hypothetical protein